MKNQTLGRILFNNGCRIVLLSAFVDFIIISSIANKIAGFWGIVGAIFLFPISFPVIPWYALIVYGDWWPLVIVYGGGLLTTTLIGLGHSLLNDDLFGTTPPTDKLPLPISSKNNP